MKLRNILTTLFIFGALLISCEEVEETTEAIVREETTEVIVTEEITDCKKTDFDFSARKGFNDEIIIVADAPFEPLNDGFTYQWDIKETANGITNEEKDVAGSDNSFARNLSEGTFEYCLKTISQSCPEGEEVCKTLIVTQEQLNSAKSELTEKIDVVLTTDGNYTLSISKSSNDCEAVDFELSVFESFDDVFFTGLNAPLPSEIGLQEVEYTWNVNKTLNRETTRTEDLASGDNEASFELSVGTYEFCLKTTHSGCVEGTETCKTLVVTEEQFEDMNTNPSSIEKIDIIPTTEGMYTLSISKSANDCEAVDFELSVFESFDDVFFTGLNAPLPSETGLQEVEYTWNVNKTLNGETTRTEDLASGDNGASFELSVGTYEFCLKTTHSGCVEGTEICKTLVVTEEQFEDINTNPSSIEKINVVLTTENNFTLEIVR